MVVVGVIVCRSVCKFVAGASVVADVTVTVGVGSDRHEQAVDKALDAHVCRAAGIVADVLREVELDFGVVTSVEVFLSLLFSAGASSVVALETQLNTEISVFVTVVVEV